MSQQNAFILICLLGFCWATIYIASRTAVRYHVDVLPLKQLMSRPIFTFSLNVDRTTEQENGKDMGSIGHMPTAVGPDPFTAVRQLIARQNNRYMERVIPYTTDKTHVTLPTIKEEQESTTPNTASDKTHVTPTLNTASVSTFFLVWSKEITQLALSWLLTKWDIVKRWWRCFALRAMLCVIVTVTLQLW